MTAHIVSLGTHRDYYLSTAKKELGVVYAKSLAGDVGPTTFRWFCLMGVNETGRQGGKGCLCQKPCTQALAAVLHAVGCRHDKPPAASGQLADCCVGLQSRQAGAEPKTCLSAVP